VPGVGTNQDGLNLVVRQYNTQNNVTFSQLLFQPAFVCRRRRHHHHHHHIHGHHAAI
jgi:hypothetical protein